MTSGEFAAHLEQVAARVQEALEPGRPASAWDLKVRLRVSQSHLQMALGLLLGRGRIRMAPDQLSYLVEPVAAEPRAASAQPAPAGPETPLTPTPVEAAVPHAAAAE